MFYDYLNGDAEAALWRVAGRGFVRCGRAALFRFNFAHHPFDLIDALVQTIDMLVAFGDHPDEVFQKCLKAAGNILIVIQQAFPPLQSALHAAWSSKNGPFPPQRL